MIVITYDPDCEMMRIENDNICLFEGNYWDFDHSPSGLRKFIKDLGIRCRTVKKKYE